MWKSEDIVPPLRFPEGKKANREEIIQETWISVFIPILKEPTLGTENFPGKLHFPRDSGRLVGRGGEKPKPLMLHLSVCLTIDVTRDGACVLSRV